MKASILIASLTVLAPLVPAAAPAVPSAPQDADPVVDKREEVKELVDSLKGHVKKKGKEDELAISVIDKLVQEFPRSGPKDRALVVKQMEACFKAKRPKELEPGVPDDRLYYAATLAMSRMGPESVKPLSGLVGAKTIRKNLRIQREIVLALGKTQDLKAMEVLLDLLDHPDATILKATAEGLAYFPDAPQKERKEAFEEVMKLLMGHKYKKDTEPSNPDAQERWNTVSGPFVACLQRLSGHDERDPDAWQRWWNDNKKRDWDEDEDD